MEEARTSDWLFDVDLHPSSELGNALEWVMGVSMSVFLRNVTKAQLARTGPSMRDCSLFEGRASWPSTGDSED